MKYQNFKTLVKNHPLILAPQLAQAADNRRTFNNQISNWKRRGLIIGLKKGIYLLNEHDRKLTPSREFIANQLVFPSYVSLEFALAAYGLIPERVFQVTSVTSKKTQEFENALGTFNYRSIRQDLFFGFQTLRDENGMQFLIAEKEKALLDLTYLNLAKINSDWSDFIELSLRIEDMAAFDMNRLVEYSQRFRAGKLAALVAGLSEVSRW